MATGSPVTPEEATARIEQRNHEPLEPYPGRVRDQWKMRCLTCGHESSKTLSRASDPEFGCMPCASVNSRKTCSEILPSGNRCTERISYHYGGKCSWHGASPSKLRSRLCELTNPKTGERCVRKHRAKGMCEHHRGKERTHGDPFYERDTPYLISEEEAAAVMKARGLTPLEPFHGADSPWLCRCDVCGQDSSPRYASRNTTHGCKHCGLKRRANKQRTSEAEAVTIMKEKGLTPSGPYQNAHALWECQCDVCGKTVMTCFHSARKGSGCIYCAGGRVDPKEAVKVMKEAGFTPLKPYTNAGASWESLCDTCGKVTSPTYSHIKDGHGCKYCHGGPFTKFPTILYLMKNSELGALKIGITIERSRGKHHSERRMKEHGKAGFTPVKTWLFPTGELAYNMEQQVLRHWREVLNAPQFLEQSQMGNNGATETASTRKVGLQKTIDYIESQIPQTVVHS